MTDTNSPFAPALDLLARVQKLQPLAPGRERTPAELTIRRLITWLTWAGGILMLLLILLSVPLYVCDSLRSDTNYKYMMLGLAIATMSCSLIWMVIDMVSGLFFLRKEGLRLAEREWLEAQHDFAQVAQLLDVDQRTIETVSAWINTEIERIRSRISFFFGSVDKLAIFSLAGLGWSVWSVFSGLPSNDWKTLLVQFILAFLCGNALGAMVLRVRLARLTYHKDLLGLAAQRIQQQGVQSPPLC